MGKHSAFFALCLGLVSAACAGSSASRQFVAPASDAAESPSCADAPVPLSTVRPLVTKYCASCHSPNGAAADYNWTDEPTLLRHRKGIAARVGRGIMPPPGQPRPDADERRALLCWASAPQTRADSVPSEHDWQNAD